MRLITIIDWSTWYGWTLVVWTHRDISAQMIAIKNWPLTIYMGLLQINASERLYLLPTICSVSELLLAKKCIVHYFNLKWPDTWQYCPNTWQYLILPELVQLLAGVYGAMTSTICFRIDVCSRSAEDVLSEKQWWRHRPLAVETTRE